LARYNLLPDVHAGLRFWHALRRLLGDLGHEFVRATFSTPQDQVALMTGTKHVPRRAIDVDAAQKR
jgi:hypothetical protein